MTAGDTIITRVMEILEKLTLALAGRWARVETMSRRVSLSVRRVETEKELERAYARLGRMMYSAKNEETGGAPSDQELEEALQAVSHLLVEMEELEQSLGTYAANKPEE